MKKNKILLIISLISFFCAAKLSAQITTNPAHDFYSDCIKWEVQGIIDALPPLRPYPYSTVKDILQTVIESENSKEAEKAQSYYLELTGRKYNINLEVKDTVLNFSDNLLSIFPSVYGSVPFFNDFVSLEYKLGLDGRTSESTSSYRPLYTNYDHDSIQDPVNAGIFKAYIDMNNLICIGNKNLYLQGGVYRSGFGPFINEGLCLNDSAYHSGNLSFTYFNENLSYAQQMSVIGASSLYNGTNVTSDKVLAFHQLEYKPFDFLSVTYYETIVYGSRFDFSYILPVPYMVAQGINGCNDNLQMGLLFKTKLLNCLSVNWDFYVDDLDTNKLLKLNVNSKNRIASHLGLTYYSTLPLLENVSLNYTIVTPYTYSHWDYDNAGNGTITSKAIGYENYTNNGIPIGSAYAPNSDVINLNLTLNPVKNLKIKLNGNFIRHGNVNLSLTEEEALIYLSSPENVYATDSSIFNHPMISNPDGVIGSYLDTAWNNLNFLNQENLMYTIQAGTKISYKLPQIYKFNITFNAEYTYEYIMNNGVSSNLYPGGQVTKATDSKGNVTYIWNNKTYTSQNAGEIVNYYKNLWRNNLKNTYNNYLTLSLEIRY